MRVNYLTLIASAAAAMLIATTTRADESAASSFAAEAGAAPPAATTTASVARAAPATGDTATYDDDADPVQDFIARAGAWAVRQSGSPTKVDEYQGRTSSPFLNLDGIMSNGERTLDFSATESDNDDQNARLHFFGPRVEADVSWEQFPHELDAHNFAGWNYNLNFNNNVGPSNTTTSSANRQSIVVYSNDNRAPGQDYAISVQEFKAKFKGDLTENLKWRVDVFGIDKEGLRQASSFTHCSQASANGSSSYNTTAPNATKTNPVTNSQLTSQCHTVSQSQHIDWQTTEITPALELRMDCDTSMEYSHLVRSFTANDQATRYGYFANSGVSLNPPNQAASSSAGYAFVPDSETQIDRLKFSTRIGSDTDVYLLGYAGYNEDMLRETYRNFNGADLRITNNSIEKLTLTGYGKYYREDSTTPALALSPTSAASPTVPANNFFQEADLSNIGDQINREVHTFGVNARWRPFQDDFGTLRSRLSLVGGYEYSTLIRENSGDALYGQTVGSGPFPFIYQNSNPPPALYFSQPNSNKNTFSLGVDERWSPAFDTFLRYKFISTDYPLYGITNEIGYSVDAALNSSLPTQENRVEIGGTWTPTDTLMVNATLYVENAMSDAPYVNWQSNSLPFVLSAWWAPTCDWSINGGVAVMDSWIDQDVTLGQLQPGNTAVNVPWKYTGTADVFNLGTRYMLTKKMALSGTFEYVHGLNTSYAPVDPSKASAITPGAPGDGPAPSYTIGQYSLVKMDSYRFGVGADYILRPRVTTYVRYDYYDYQDESGLTSGQQNSILGGMSATF